LCDFPLCCDTQLNSNYLRNGVFSHSPGLWCGGFRNLTVDSDTAVLWISRTRQIMSRSHDLHENQRWTGLNWIGCIGLDCFDMTRNILLVCRLCVPWFSPLVEMESVKMSRTVGPSSQPPACPWPERGQCLSAPRVVVFLQSRAPVDEYVREFRYLILPSSSDITRTGLGSALLSFFFFWSTTCVCVTWNGNTVVHISNQARNHCNRSGDCMRSRNGNFGNARLEIYFTSLPSTKAPCLLVWFILLRCGIALGVGLIRESSLEYCTVSGFGIWDLDFGFDRLNCFSLSLASSSLPWTWYQLSGFRLDFTRLVDIASAITIIDRTFSNQITFPMFIGNLNSLFFARPGSYPDISSSL